MGWRVGNCHFSGDYLLDYQQSGQKIGNIRVSCYWLAVLLW
jgi:hypothetical protein